MPVLKGGVSEGATAGEGTAKSDRQVNIELMKAMGSPNGSDPIPPSQYLYFLDDPDPVQRVVAWTRSKTIRQGHRSPYAVALDGKVVLGVKDLANDCFNRDRSNATRAWQAAEAQKLVYRDQDGQLCLCGNVPTRDSQQRNRQLQENKEGAKVCTDFLKVCTDYSIPKYVCEDVGRLEPQSQAEFAAEYKRFLEWADDVEADAIAAARAAVEAREKPLYDKYGIRWRDAKKRRNDPDRPDPRPEYVQLKLLHEPDSVQTKTQPVQGEEPTLYMPKNGAVQDESRGPSLYSSEQRNTTEARAGDFSVIEEASPFEEPARPPASPPEPEEAPRQVEPAPAPEPEKEPEEPDDLARMLAERQLFPDGKLQETIREQLNGTPLMFFAQKLDARLKRGRVGTGLLPMLAEETRTQWKAAQPQPKAEPQPNDTSGVCRKCHGGGFRDGFMWSVLPEAEEHYRAGAAICDCEDGKTLKEFVGATP